MDKTQLIKFLDSLENLGIPGCDCAIYQNHEEIFRHITGFEDCKKTRPLTNDTTYWIYSASKVITCVAFMRLVDNGKVNLDDPVYRYLPEYKNIRVKNGSSIEPAKNTMAIRHLMTMQSGIDYNIHSPSIKQVLKDSDNKATTRQIAKAIANEPLHFEPGTHYMYSLSHDVLGAVIEIVSGQSFGEYLHEHIFKPLGMINTGFKLTPDRKANMSAQFKYHEKTSTSTPTSIKNPLVPSDNFESGGAGLISTVDDYITFLDAISCGGISRDGYRILSMESINEMRRNQLSEASKKDFDPTGINGYSYGLGVRTLIEKEVSGVKSPLGEFGWGGAAGAYALMDVDNKLSIFYAQHVLESPFVFDKIHPKIRDIAYDTLGLG